MPVETETQRQVKHPVVEIFGPVTQGEGHFAGQITHFVRFGGCDYRCSWCDSKYAVDPREVRENARMLTDSEIVDELEALPGNPAWVVLSGGNPALHELGPLVDQLHETGYKVMVETQGTVHREWLKDVHHVTVSPKPPSSGNPTPFAKTVEFIEAMRFDESLSVLRDIGGLATEVSLKVVVFDDADYDYARSLFYTLVDHTTEYEIPLYLSCGTKTPEVAGNWTTPWSPDEVDDTASLLARYKWLTEKAAADPQMGDVSVLCQLHTLLYSHKRGV